MKNSLSIAVAVLAVCVIILFVLQFKNSGSSNGTVSQSNAKDSLGYRSLKVAYVDLDSIQENASDDA